MSAHFIEIGMGAVAHHDLVATTAMGEERNGVTHRARRHKERGVFAHFLGCQLFQAIDARVLPIYVVADFSAIHRLPHSWRGMRDGITAEINRGAGCKGTDPRFVAARHSVILDEYLMRAQPCFVSFP